MKIISIGDLHGKNCWTSISIEDYQKIIFLGDYVDNKLASNDSIINNLKELITLKKKYSDKVILLLGNHDIQYSEFPNYKYQGFNDKIQPELTQLFQDNRNLFSIAHLEGNVLFSHAGLTNQFFSKIFGLSSLEFKKENRDVAKAINDLHSQPSEQYKLHVIGYKRGGSNKHGGITWADIEETSIDFILGYHQIVGHSKRKKFEKFSNNKEDDSNASITYIDVLETETKFFEMEI